VVDIQVVLKLILFCLFAGLFVFETGSYYIA
jgi:hypothetical protein